MEQYCCSFRPMLALPTQPLQVRTTKLEAANNYPNVRNDANQHRKSQPNTRETKRRSKGKKSAIRRAFAKHHQKEKQIKKLKKKKKSRRNDPVPSIARNKKNPQESINPNAHIGLNSRNKNLSLSSFPTSISISSPNPTTCTSSSPASPALNS